MDTSQQLQRAYEAAKAGDRPGARRMVKDILEIEPNNEAAWYFYARIAGDRQKSIECLEKVLEINPSHERAQQDLERLSQGSPKRISPSQSGQKSTQKQRATKLPAWIWMLGAGLSCIIVACFSYIVFAGALQPPSQPSIPNTQQPLVISTPTNDCTCTRATEYLEKTFARVDIISAQIISIENAYNDGTLWEFNFTAYSSEAKTIYREQIAESPPFCLEALQNKTVSLFWNWQQSMEYAANGQYDAVDVFFQGFMDDVSALESEGARLLQEELNGCIIDPDAGPNI